MVNVFYKPKRLVHRNEEVFMQQTNQPPINQDSTKVLTVQTLQKSRFLKKKKILVPIGKPYAIEAHSHHV
jgi:hypothetical protein